MRNWPCTEKPCNLRQAATIGCRGSVAPLLNASVAYDPAKALQLVRDILVTRIPGEPWRGDKSKGSK